MDVYLVNVEAKVPTMNAGTDQTLKQNQKGVGAND